MRHLHAVRADVASDVALLVTHYAGAGWSWSFGVHGPADFVNFDLNHVAEKATDARFVTAISDFARSQVMTVAPEKCWKDIHVVRCGVDPSPPRPRRSTWLRIRHTSSASPVLSSGKVKPFW